MIHRVFVATVLLLSSALAMGDEPSDDDVRRIEGEVVAYVEAFNAKDAGALAQHWSESGVYVRPEDGRRLVGRKAIQKEFEATFAEQPKSLLAVTVHTIRFVTRDVAIEEGSAEVTALPDTIPTCTDYTAVHVKRDGQWRIDSIRETELPQAEEAAGDRLSDLAWLIGDWVDQNEDATLETVVNWAKNKAFLSYTFKVSTGNVDELEGTQIVGWDPIAKRIRSWMFDSDGGFGEGAWSHEDNQWVVTFRQVLADGRTASSTNVYTYIDDNKLLWASVGREVAGESLPNVDPVTLVRKPAETP